MLGCGVDWGDGTHGIGQERNGDTPAPVRIDDGDCVDGGGDRGDDEDCDPSVPGTHAGCHSRSSATTVMTSLTTAAMDQSPSHYRHDYDSHRNCRYTSADRSSEHRPNFVILATQTIRGIVASIHVPLCASQFSIAAMPTANGRVVKPAAWDRRYMYCSSPSVACTVVHCFLTVIVSPSTCAIYPPVYFYCLLYTSPSPRD